MPHPLAIYIHWPFCKAKCPYCDFNSHVRETIAFTSWNDSYLREIEYFAEQISHRYISSIFFGGGTPSLMEPRIIENIINKLAQLGHIDEQTEITLEANPTSIETEKFYNFKLAGINRVSIGIQAFNEADLKFLGREHSATEAIDALAVAQKLFKRFSFDLIYTRPHQTPHAWQEELEFALQFGSDHLSLYQLTIEKGTPFYTQYQRKQFTLPLEDQALELFTLTQDIMAAHNMPAYEISNHAKYKEESRHNLTYWLYNDYLGIGPGAHSRLNSREIVMISSPEAWLRSIEARGTGIQRHASLSIKQAGEEMVMMGLRLTDGIRLEDFVQKLGVKMEEVINQNKLQQLIKMNLVTLTDTSLVVTAKGRPVLNRIIMELL
jgi:oxygen-independent coproporphyrinogen-3 oxidase